MKCALNIVLHGLMILTVGMSFCSEQNKQCTLVKIFKLNNSESLKNSPKDNQATPTKKKINL